MAGDGFVMGLRVKISIKFLNGPCLLTAYYICEGPENLVELIQPNASVNSPCLMDGPIVELKDTETGLTAKAS